MATCCGSGTRDSIDHHAVPPALPGLVALYAHYRGEGGLDIRFRHVDWTFLTLRHGVVMVGRPQKIKLPNKRLFTIQFAPGCFDVGKVSANSAEAEARQSKAARHENRRRRFRGGRRVQTVREALG